MFHRITKLHLNLSEKIALICKRFKNFLTLKGLITAVEIGRSYKHYKGKIVIVIAGVQYPNIAFNKGEALTHVAFNGIAEVTDDCEKGETIVIYQDLPGSKLWARPLKIFEGTVEVKRFVHQMAKIKLSFCKTVNNSLERDTYEVDSLEAASAKIHSYQHRYDFVEVNDIEEKTY